MAGDEIVRVISSLSRESREDSLFRVDQLKKAINLLKAEPKDALFVGNTDGDAAAAEKAGCQFLRIT